METPVFENAKRLHEENPQTFKRGPIEPVIDSYVKVCQVNIEKPERFWIKIIAMDGEDIAGTIANNLLFSPLKYGAMVSFHTDCIYAILPPDTTVGTDSEKDNVNNVHSTCNAS